MTKLLAILSNAPSVMSGCVHSTDKYYLEFLDKFEAKKLEFGSMSKDRVNYSKDFNKVYNDLKRAKIQYRKQSKIG